MVDPNHYKKAIESAEEEREQLLVKLQELEAIKQRVFQLDTFIEKGKALLGLENKEDIWNVSSTGQERTKEDSEMPNHMKVAKVIREAGRAMTLTELVEEFKKRNWKLSKDNPRQVLRGSFAQHPEMFSQEVRKNGGIPCGYYSLKE